MVSLETTVPVGTTRWRFAPALEAHQRPARGRRLPRGVQPRARVDGRVFRDLDTYPKLVGGLDAEGERRGVALYGEFIAAEVRAMGSAEAAELTKLAETTYRDLNIAFANELAVYADRLALDVAARHRRRQQPAVQPHPPARRRGRRALHPGLPALPARRRPGARLPRVAREVNDAMPAYAVDLLAERLGGSLEGRAILILGVAYRGGVKETAFSGAAALRDELRARGARPRRERSDVLGGRARAAGYEPWSAGEAVDGAIVQADHAEYRTLDVAQLGGATIVVDGRGVLDGEALAAAGVRVLRIGRPSD